jgi:hypothetical protein
MCEREKKNVFENESKVRVDDHQTMRHNESEENFIFRETEKER